MSADGTLSGTLGSPTGAVPITTGRVTGARFVLSATLGTGLRLDYDGVVSHDTIRGTWRYDKYQGAFIGRRGDVAPRAEAPLVAPATGTLAIDSAWRNATIDSMMREIASSLHRYRTGSACHRRNSRASKCRRLRYADDSRHVCSRHYARPATLRQALFDLPRDVDRPATNAWRGPRQLWDQAHRAPRRQRGIFAIRCVQPRLVGRRQRAAISDACTRSNGRAHSRSSAKRRRQRRARSAAFFVVRTPVRRERQPICSYEPLPDSTLQQS